MDVGVALVDAYLCLNGYFTVLEYPPMERTSRFSRIATDIDVLAFRFEAAGYEVFDRSRSIEGPISFRPDPELGCQEGKGDMIFGEVKQGRGRFNSAARDPLVVAAALARFGCCPVEHSVGLAARLVKDGRAVGHAGHEIRMVSFAGTASRGPRWRTITMAHMAGFIRQHFHDHPRLTRSADFKSPALSFLALMENSGAWGPNPKNPGRSGGR